MLVVDASAVVAALVDNGPEGVWGRSLLTEELAAPHLLPAEATDTLRRTVLARDLSVDEANLIHAELVRLPLRLYPYHPYAERVWELRHNVTAYDAWYVALAEALDAELATLDRRLARSKGPRCRFLTPGR